MTVGKILEVQPDSWQGLTRTVFQVQEDGAKAYMLTRPNNVPKEGDQYKGEYKIDRGGNRKFNRDKEDYPQQDSPQTSPGAAERQFRADPVKQESIEWQACLKAAVQAVHDWNEIAVTREGYVFPGRPDYMKQIAETLITFTQTIERKPDSFTRTEPVETTETMTDQGDFAQVDFSDDDRPPVENYDKQPPQDINLDDIPF